MPIAKLIVDHDEFSLLKAECEKIINTQQRLPDFVFRRSFTNFFVLEYNYLYKNNFGAFLQKMSTLYNDSTINFITLDPDPGARYMEEFLHFGVAQFDPKLLSEQYVSTMCLDERTRFLPLTNIGAFWGSSLNWAIFCDRISWELVLIAISGAFDLSTISDFPCMNRSTLSHYLMSQYTVKDPSVATDFLQRFFSNYKI